MKKYQREYNTPYQLKFPIEIEKIIETTDSVYTFCEVIDHIDLNKYLTAEERRTGRPRYDEKTFLKVILFAFMENGYESLRKIEKQPEKDIFQHFNDRQKALYFCRCVCCTLFSRLDSSFLLCDILKPVGFHIEEIHGLCCAFFTAPCLLLQKIGGTHMTRPLSSRQRKKQKYSML